MFCIDRASFVYSFAGSMAPVIVAAIVLAVGIVMIVRARR